MKLYDKIFPPRVIELPNGKQVFKYRSRAPLAVLVLLFLTVLSIKVTGFNMNVSAELELSLTDMAAALRYD